MQMEKACPFKEIVEGALSCSRGPSSDFSRELLDFGLEASHLLQRALRKDGDQAGRDFAVMVGNERRGLSYECAKLATDKVQVPMFSRRVNCLNVAAVAPF